MGDRQKMFLCLVRELGIEVEVNRKFDWLTNRITPSEEALWRIFIALDGDPEGMQSKRSCRLTPDGFLPEYECIIEFDELQHFTAFRSQAFEHYPEDVHLGFDIDTYRSWCDQHAISALKKGASGYRKRKPKFPFDGGRAGQRALFDACRDLLPPCVNGGAKLVHPGGAKLVHLMLCGTRCWGVVPVVHRRDPRCFV